jgi:hypothetical protein
MIGAIGNMWMWTADGAASGEPRRPIAFSQAGAA